MTHAKDYLAGELAYHYKPTTFGPLEKIRAKGKKAIEMYKHLGAMMSDHGQLDPDEIIEFFNEYKKELEVRKNGFKRKTTR